MKQTRLDIAVVSDPINLYYFSGYVTASTVKIPACLLVFEDTSPVLVVGNSEAHIAASTFGGEIVTYVNYDIERSMRGYPELVKAQVQSILGEHHGPRKIGIESWNLPHVLTGAIANGCPSAEMVDISPAILNMRAIKDQDELEAIKKGCSLLDYAYSIAKSVSEPGKTEVEVYSTICKELVEKTGSFQFFSGDFISGRRSWERTGGPPTTRVLEEKDTIILDLWVTVRGYWADTCRTFVIGGRPTLRQLDAFEILKQAKAAGENKLMPGAKGYEVYNAILRVISEAGYAAFFRIHGGHSFGLEAWEPPFIIPGCNDELKEGMVCALEPGLNIPDVGGMRIEDNYLITDGSFQRLSSYPLEL